MIRFERLAVLVSLFLPYTAAFLPSAVKQSVRIDPSQWRLEQSDTLQSYGRLSYTNATVPAVFDSYPEQSSTALSLQIEDQQECAVDMSHFESSFQGLTGPTQAGLALSVLISVAMVAACPAVDSSFLPSDWNILSRLTDVSFLKEHGLSAAWLTEVQQDLLPVLSNKVQGLASELHDFIDTVSAKSATWQETFTSQTSSTMQRLEATTTAQLADFHNAASQFRHDIGVKGATMVENALQQVSNVREMIASTTTNFQSTIDANLREFQAEMKQTSTQMHESMDHFRRTADDNMIREGAIIKERVMAFKNQVENSLQSEMTSVGHRIVDPIIDANNAFWESFNLEVTRETTVAKQAVLDMSLQLEESWTLKSAELEKAIVPGLIRSTESFYMNAKESLSAELVQFQAVSVNTVAKTREVIIPQVTEQFQSSIDLTCKATLARMSELQDTIATKTLVAQAQAISNLEHWKDLTFAQMATEQMALAQFCDTLTRAASTKVELASSQVLNVRDLCMSSMEQMKFDFESFKKDTDSMMLQEATMMKGKMMAVQGQAELLLDNKIEKVEQLVIAPVVEGNRAIWNSVNMDFGLESSAAKQATADITSQLQATWDLKSTQFGKSVLPEISQNAETFFSNSRDSLSSDSLKLKSIVTELRDNGSKDVIVSFSEMTKPDAMAVADIGEASFNDSVNSVYDRLQDQLMKSL